MNAFEYGCLHGHGRDRQSLVGVWLTCCSFVAVWAAPPKGLDDDEFAYITELESKKSDVERQRQAQHQDDLADFRTHRAAGLCTLQMVLS